MNETYLIAFLVLFGFWLGWNGIVNLNGEHRGRTAFQIMLGYLVMSIAIAKIISK